MWDVLTKYVNSYFEENKKDVEDPNLWHEIRQLCLDLTQHNLNPNIDMNIHNNEELKQFCVYLIYHASFYHSYVHFKVVG